MVEPPFDAYLNTPNKSVRQNVPRKGVVLHHAAMTSLSGLERLSMGAKQVSATAIAKDRISKRLMTDGFRAWSLSSAWGDSSFRSVETCNESTDGWTISDASHWELAHLVAYWAQTDGFWPHRSGPQKTWTVVGHREMYTIWDVSYATACPGGMNLNLVTTRAQGLLKSSAVAGNPPVPIPTIGDLMYIEALSDGKYARKGFVYTNDIGGHWRGVTNLEGEGYIKPLASQGKLPYVKFNGTDIDLLFAVSGVWEQAEIDSTKAPKWGVKPGTSLAGLGALSGRLLYPGTSDWSYPIAEAAPTTPPAA